MTRIAICLHMEAQPGPVRRMRRDQLEVAAGIGLTPRNTMRLVSLGLWLGPHIGTHDGLASQRGGSAQPNIRNNELSSPSSGLSTHSHSSELATTGTIAGR